MTRVFHPDGFVTIWCSDCGAPYHPKTGVALTEDYVLCLRCKTHSMRWLSARLNGKPKRGRPNFFDYVTRRQG